MLDAEAGDRLCPCPCGSGLKLADCCARYICGGEQAPDPERLMRSRFTAYVLHKEAYLLATWDPRKRPRRIFEPGETPVRWQSLTILASTLAKNGRRGTVTFRAVGVGDEGPFAMTEKSRFEINAGRWRYVDGELSVEALPASAAKD